MEGQFTYTQASARASPAVLPRERFMDMLCACQRSTQARMHRWTQVLVSRRQDAMRPCLSKSRGDAYRRSLPCTRDITQVNIMIVGHCASEASPFVEDNHTLCAAALMRERLSLAPSGGVLVESSSSRRIDPDVRAALLTCLVSIVSRARQRNARSGHSGHSRDGRPGATACSDAAPCLWEGREKPAPTTLNLT